MLAAIVTCLFVNVTSAQNPTTLPYDCNQFADHADWTLLNGECVNVWHIGKPDGESELKLYISSDRTTAGTYDNEAISRVFACREFKDVAKDVEMITVTFDIEVVGETDYDFLKVFLLASGGSNPDLKDELKATTGFTYSSPFSSDDTEYTGRFKEGYGIAHYKGKVSMQIKRPIVNMSDEQPSQNILLAFCWQNDGGYGSNPAPIISNVKVYETPENEVFVFPPEDFFFEPLTKTSAGIGWEAGDNGTLWQVKLGENGTVETCTDTQFEAKNLEKGNKYTLFVQEQKDSRWSQWTPFEFVFDYNPTVNHSFVGKLNANQVQIMGYYKEFDFYKAKKVGVAYKPSYDKNAPWTNIDAKDEDIDTLYNSFSVEVGNLESATYYDYTAYTVNQDDEIIYDNEGVANFVTNAKDIPQPSSLPYNATMDSQDEWVFTNGDVNWCKDESSNTLYLSDNGKDKSFSQYEIHTFPFAYKSIVAGENKYITFECDAHIGGMPMLDRMYLTRLHIVVQEGELDESKALTSFTDYLYFNGVREINNYDGKIRITIENPAPAPGKVLTLGLIWEQSFIYSKMIRDDMADMAKNIIQSLFDAYDTRITLSNITIKAENDDFYNAYTPIAAEYSLSGENAVNLLWGNANLSQVKLDDGAIISLDLYNEDEGNISYNDITLENVSFGEHTAYIRNRFVRAADDTVYSDWVSLTFLHSTVGERYRPQVMQTTPIKEGGITKLGAYVIPREPNRSDVISLGFEYKQATDKDWIEAPCESSDMTLYSEEDLKKEGITVKGETLDFALAKIEKSLTDLVANTEYETRAYAKLSDGVKVYSNILKFVSSNVGLQNADNNTQILIYPNPAKEYTTLLVDGLMEKSQIHIIDMQGRILSTQTLTNNDKLIKINTSNLATGVYYITVQNQKQRFVEKLIIK